MSKDRSTLHSFSILTVITITEKIIAFVFEAIIAAVIGTNAVTDGYFTTAEMFTLIDSAFLSAITVVALNRYAFHVKNEGEEKGFEALSNLQSFYLILMVAVTVLVFSFARPLSYVVAPGYDDNARNIVIRCIRVMSVIPSVVCVTSIGLAVLRQKKMFGITGLKSLFISLVGIAGVLIFGRGELTNADVLSISFVISMVSYCVLVTLSVRKYGKIKLRVPKFNAELKNTLKMLLPLMVSYGVARVALMVDKIVASTLAEGSVSALTYSHSLYKVVGAIFITNLSTIILTDFNNLCAKNEIEKVRNKIISTVSAMTLVLIPITVVSVFNSEEIVKIVYERGKFSSEATVLVGSVLLFYALNFIPAMIHGVYNQALYGFGDTLKPMIIAAVAVVVNLGTSIPLAMLIGLPGVAIGTLVSSICTVILARIAIKKYIPDYHGCYTLKYLLKVLASGVVCIAGVIAVTMLIKNAFWSFAVSTVVAFGLFGMMLILLKEEVCMSYFKTICKKLSKKH